MLGEILMKETEDDVSRKDNLQMQQGPWENVSR